LERHARTAADESDHELALSLWKRLAALEPTSAPAVSGLMRVLSTMGDRAAALRCYREHEDAVREELGVAPDATVAALAASLLHEHSHSPSVATTIDRSIAVLPLVNLSGDKANDYFGEGLAGEMTNALRVAGLRVIGPGSTRVLAAREHDAPTIGKQLGVA